MLSWGMDIAVDLGTSSVLIYVKGKGVVLKEPSVVAMEKDSRRLLAIGEEARRMLGRTPGNIVAVRPLRDGVIADYDVTETMLRHFLAKVCGKRALMRPRVMVCVPSGVTSVERRAVVEACLQAGARKTYLIEEPLAAALGAGLDIVKPSGSMVVDIGGGTTDIAILSMGDVVISDSLRVGGDKFDEAIAAYVKRVHKVMIGERSAEELKIQIGSVDPAGREASMDVRGRDLVCGLPRTIAMSAANCREAMAEPTAAVLHALKSVLEQCPPELAADILDRGLVMTGGGSLLDGLDKLLHAELGIPVRLAEDPISCVVVGAGLALDCAVRQPGDTTIRRVM